MDAMTHAIEAYIGLAKNPLSDAYATVALRKIAENDFSNLGDTSTLADPTVVDDLVKNRSK